VVLAAGVLVLVVGQGVSAYSATEIKPAEGPMAGGQEVTIKGDFPRNRNGVRSVDVNASGNLSVLLNDGRVFLHDKFGTTQEMTLPAELAGKDVRGFVRGMDTLGLIVSVQRQTENCIVGAIIETGCLMAGRGLRCRRRWKLAEF
jgi:hypothetical protein